MADGKQALLLPGNRGMLTPPFCAEGDGFAQVDRGGCREPCRDCSQLPFQAVSLPPLSPYRLRTSTMMKSQTLLLQSWRDRARNPPPPPPPHTHTHTTPPPPPQHSPPTQQPPLHPLLSTPSTTRKHTTTAPITHTTDYVTSTSPRSMQPKLSRTAHPLITMLC